jgi:NADPH2:quinone reductase
VHAASGALGLAACQVAKSLGAFVIGTASTAEKRAVAAERGGADVVIDYTDDGWPNAVKKAIVARQRRQLQQQQGADSAGAMQHGAVAVVGAGGGVDVVFDPVGLAMESSKLMGYHARLLVLGFTGWNSQGGMESRQGLPQFAVRGSAP